MNIVVLAMKMQSLAIADDKLGIAGDRFFSWEAKNIWERHIFFSHDFYATNR